MNVLISSIGSRGEVQPILAPALELGALGHRASLCVAPNFKPWVESFGVECIPIGPDLQKFVAQSASQPKRRTPSKAQWRPMIEHTVRDQFRVAILPPGVSSTDFAAALREFAAAVGDDWVLASDEDLISYRDHYSPVPLAEDELLPSAAVAPTTVEQAQAIVRTANRYKVPLDPISTGKNFAYGGPTPNLRGSVVVDLKRMDRILEVNADTASRAR